MTLDVSGGEFASSMHRMMFAASEVGTPGPVSAAVDLDTVALSVIAWMKFCQFKGWPLGSRIVELLRERVEAQG